MTGHEGWHRSCYHCSYEDEPDHDDCDQRCGETDCAGPCVCDCGKPLSRNEMEKLHRFLESLK